MTKTSQFGGQRIFIVSLHRLLFLSVAIVVCCMSSSAWAGNLIQNGGFDTPTPGLSPPNYPASISGAPASGPSSAEDWTLSNRFYSATTSTELLSTTDPYGSGLMIQFTSVPIQGGYSYLNGLLQNFTNQMGLGTAASVDIYAVSGPVFLGLFNSSGSLLTSIHTLVTDQWVTLTVSESPGNTDPTQAPSMIGIYSINSFQNSEGEFYADNAIVTSFVPEPSSVVLALIAISSTAIWVRLNRRLTQRSA